MTKKPIKIKVPINSETGLDQTTSGDENLHLFKMFQSEEFLLLEKLGKENRHVHE